MPIDPTPVPDLDDRTARLGRQWFAEARQRERDEKAEAKRRQARRNADDADDTGLVDWLFGGDEADGGGDGGGD